MRDKKESQSACTTISPDACLIAKVAKKYDDLESNNYVGSEHFPKDYKLAFPFFFSKTTGSMISFQSMFLSSKCNCLVGILLVHGYSVWFDFKDLIGC